MTPVFGVEILGTFTDALVADEARHSSRPYDDGRWVTESTFSVEGGLPSRWLAGRRPAPLTTYPSEEWT